MSAKSRVRRAKHHYAAHKRLLATDPDWASVALFYSAMHLVDSVLNYDENVPEHYRTPEDHLSRKLVVKTHYSAIAKQYELLLHYSHIARYKFGPAAEQAFSPEVMGNLSAAYVAVDEFCLRKRGGRG